MFRRTSALALGVALLAAATGCRSSCNNCNNSHGWFTSNARQDVPCQLVSNGKAMDGCFDAVTGVPVPCPPPGATVLPGGGYPYSPPPVTRPDELPYPSPSDLIPRPGVPYAPPYPAPGGEGASAVPKAGTTPVKVGPNK
jgi:hypothetical protein